jgi:glycerate kinase
MHILIAPNAFKNSLDAETAAKAIDKGLRESRLSCTTTIFPLGDGGDGTGDLLIRHSNGRILQAIATDPLGRQISTVFGLIDKDKTAVIELARASGLSWLSVNEYDPLRTSTRGTGEMIKQALDLDVNKIILAIGGSATVDGGCGILETLGVRFLTQEGKVCKQLPGDLITLDRIDLSGLDPRIANIELIILCDVENHLLGPLGAAAVYGPQKGASLEIIENLEAGLARLSVVADKLTGKDMSNIEFGGAAGGVAAGLCVLINAKLVSGIEYFLDHTDFDRALERTDLLITAEGSIDGQTMRRKGPLGAAMRAKANGIPVIGIAGRVPLKTNGRLESFFDVILPIGHEPMELQTALNTTSLNLVRTARGIGNLLGISGRPKFSNTL